MVACSRILKYPGAIGKMRTSFYVCLFPVVNAVEIDLFTKSRAEVPSNNSGRLWGYGDVYREERVLVQGS